MSLNESHLRRSPRRTSPDAQESRPDLRVIRRRSRRLIVRGSARRMAPMAILSLILVGAVIFAVLLEQVVLAQSAFKLSRLEQRLARAQERHQALLVEATTLESPGRIERYARRRLGMVDPSDIRYLVADVGQGRSSRFGPGARRSSLPATGRAAASAHLYGAAP